MNPNISHLTAADRIERSTLSRRIEPGTARVVPLKDFGGESKQPEKKKFVAKGHDSQLQDAQYGKHPVEITTLAGEIIKGTVSRRDKFTITVLLASGGHTGKDLIIYKHAIESVLVDKRVAPQE